MEGPDSSFFDRVDAVVEACGRYRREAFFFIYSALDHTVRALNRDAAAAGRHVTGQELSRGIADYGRQQFGPLVGAVFEHWGVRETLDFGRIVYALIDGGLMSRTEGDRLEDFEGVYDFRDVFDPDVILTEVKDIDLDRL